MVIGDSMLKHIRSNKLSSSDTSISILKYPDCSLEDMVDYVKPAVRRSSPPEVFLGKGVLKICSKFTGEHPC